jgi:hypothetical protein
MMVPRIVLGLLAAAFALNFFLSDREWGLTSMPAVEAIDTLPDRPELASVRHYTEIGSGLLPYTARRRAAHADDPVDPRPPVRVGYAYRELSILRLPLWASEEAGLVTYFETRAGWQIAIMVPEQVRLLERMSGRSYSGYSFPFWKHMWGWLFALGLVLWYVLQRRAEAKWREETGII